MWRRCVAPAQRRVLLDQLSDSYRRRGERVAVLCAPEAVVSNLSALENILLPAAWHGRPPELAPAVIDILAQHYVAPAELLARRGASLSMVEREMVGLARAVQLGATMVLVEDDEERRAQWLEERLQRIAAALPAARMEVVSLREAPPGFDSTGVVAVAELT